MQDAPQPFGNGLPAEPPNAAVLAAPPRPVPLAWARELAARHYGLQGDFSLLSGERDSNFLIEDDGGSRYMLKVSHPAEPRIVSDFQTRALLHMARADPGLPVQRIRPTLAGTPSVVAQGPDGRCSTVRLISYLPGVPMPKTPRSTAQRQSVARMLARTDRALAGLAHPAAQLALPWDLQRAGEVAGLLAHVPDAGRRALAGRAFDDYCRLAYPRLPGLRRQPIHNDFNLYNLLVDPDDATRVVAILDFGDMLHAPLVNDLAVAASYQIAEDGDALTTITEFAGAYHAVNPLTAEEIEVLFPLIRARLAMVVAISGWRAARDPENAPYLLRNNTVSWTRLARCEDIRQDKALAALRAACPIPSSACQP